MFFESVVFTAFYIGILSAFSLPLGTLTAFVWRPDDRVVAGMMAFGGGALLAALTIDLVASPLEEGHFNALAIGCILGGLLFIGLNQLVNDYGGFLRKASTTIYHLRRKDHLRIKGILSQLGRIDVFRNLPDKEFRILAQAVDTRSCPAGTFVYRLGDNADNLYIIADGSVELLDPLKGMRSVETLKKNDAFGRTAIFTGTPHALVAVAKEDSLLWVVPRSKLSQLLENSSMFRQVVHRWLRQDEVYEYLRTRHHLGEEEAREILGRASANLIQTGEFPDLIPVERKMKEFRDIGSRIRRVPWLEELTDAEVEVLSGYLQYRELRKGESLFHQGDVADRMYILDTGRVSLLDPRKKYQRPLKIGAHNGFGAMGIITGCPYSVSAVTTKKSSVWELRWEDLARLLKERPEFRERILDALDHPVFDSYLEHKHGASPEKIQRWKHRARRALESGLIPPSVLEGFTAREHTGAPVAIWLGIMLDGIPESLVIGASMIHSNISLSLVAGLFLSNYPEALSSSVGMEQQGLSRKRILFMWTSIMVITGIGAAAGNLFMTAAEPDMFALLEGLAAGAMLTMIAQTMLPEAYIKGGSIIGFSTLMGFLCAIFFHTL